MNLLSYLKAIVILVVLGVSIYFYNEYKTIKKENVTYASNIVAYKNVSDSISATNSIFMFTIDELEHSKDSVDAKLLATTKELKIKNSKLQSLQYYNETITKVDTLIFKDTIFVKDLKIDTIIKDEFYTLNLSLKYPNSVIVKPSFVNEKSILVSSKRETIKPPKKLWVCRLFQKKHTILTIDVHDKNPYVNTDDVRFIQIIK